MLYKHIYFLTCSILSERNWTGSQKSIELKLYNLYAVWWNLTASEGRSIVSTLTLTKPFSMIWSQAGLTRLVLLLYSLWVSVWFLFYLCMCLFGHSICWHAINIIIWKRMVNCVLAILGENNEKAMEFGLGVNLTNTLWAQDRTLLEHFTTPGNSPGFDQPPVFRDNTIVYIYVMYTWSTL